MYRFIATTALAALVSRAVAGVAPSWDDKYEVIKYLDQDWSDKCEGEEWDIKWSKGNGKYVDLIIKGDKWSYEVEKKGYAPGSKKWIVDVPKCDDYYTLYLKQEDCDYVVSPKFYVGCAADEEWTDKPVPVVPTKPEWKDVEVVKVIYIDDSCSCEKYKWTPKPAGDKKVWYDEELKCTVTYVPGPAPTGDEWKDVPVAPVKPVKPVETWADVKPVAPVVPVKPAETWADVKPVAPTGAPVAPYKPVAPVKEYTGAATKVTGSAFALAAVFAAALAL